MRQDNSGLYLARLARSRTDLLKVQTLRAKSFSGVSMAQKADAVDSKCTHVLIENTMTGGLVGSFRLMFLASGRDIEQSYSSQFYGLDALKVYKGALAEIGRFCIDPESDDPDVLRVAWGALAGFVEQHEIQMLIGCSSFKGIDPEPYHDAFARLKTSHLAPSKWMPSLKAPSVFPFAKQRGEVLNSKRALAQMPPLLRSYLLMGGWVSDHAVIDQAMNTLHVFTALEISTIPAARKRLLQANAIMIA